MKASYVKGRRSINEENESNPELYEEDSIMCKEQEMILNNMEHDKLVVSVIDNGVGMSDIDQEKMFKMFSQGNGTQGMNSHGIGLGLYVCKRIVIEFEG